MKYLITFAYDGSKYSGYQKQPRKKTVQTEIENVLKKINSEEAVTISASGRTDAGVHANNQKAHFELKKKMDPFRLKGSMNGLLPKDIYVKKVELIEDDFHARFNVERKEYIYKINMGEYNPIMKDYIYQYCEELNVPEMERALRYFEGEHNFKSFTKVDEEKDDYVRKIYKASITRDPEDFDLITISFVGNGFMRYMVRNMVGFLIEVGSGKRKSNEVISVLKAEDRKKAGITAPACGLYLNQVFY